MILASPSPEIDEQGADAQGEEKMSLSTIFKYIALILNPILTAYGSIMMRQMKNLDENVVSCYMNSTGIFVMMGLCYATGGNLTAWKDFEAIEWICIVALSISVILSQTLRFKALQYEQVSLLQPLAFLAPVYQLIADVALFSASFNLWQLVGISIVCGVFFVELVYNYCTKAKAVPKKPEAPLQVTETVPTFVEDDSFKQVKPIN